MTPAGADEPVRVLVVDDQTVVREGLVSLLSLLPGIEVVGAAVDGDDAIRQAWATDPDVVVLTTYSDDAWVFSALQADARGFLTKDAGAAEIRRAITTVAGGHAQLDPSVQSRLLDALRRPHRPVTTTWTHLYSHLPPAHHFGSVVVAFYRIA